MRILFELNERDGCTANAVIQKLGIDPSYMSRIIAKFCKAGFADKSRSEKDNREKMIFLTDKGKELIRDLIRSSNREIAKWIENFSAEDCREVNQALKTLETHLGHE